MQTDTYTKVVLTVIAIGVGLLVFDQNPKRYEDSADFLKRLARDGIPKGVGTAPQGQDPNAVVVPTLSPLAPLGGGVNMTLAEILLGAVRDLFPSVATAF